MEKTQTQTQMQTHTQTVLSRVRVQSSGLPLVRSCLHTFAIVLAISLALFYQPTLIHADPEASAPTTQAAPARQHTEVLLAGTRYETQVLYQIANDVGPTVFVLGGMHGDEPAGIAAADIIATWSVDHGTLVIVPRAHQPAVEAQRRRDPDKPKGDGDLNRNFPAQHNDTPLGEPATAIWELVTRLQPDWIIDLHEGYGYRASGSKSVGNSLIYLSSPTINPIAEATVNAINATIHHDGRKFVHLRKSGGVKGGLVAAARKRFGTNAVGVETVSKFDPIEHRVGQQLVIVDAMLQQIGNLNRSVVSKALLEKLNQFEQAATPPTPVETH